METGKRKLLILFAFVFLVFTLFLFFTVSKTRTLSPFLWNDTAFVFFLWAIILLLIVATLFLILRNIIKLFLEKKRKIIGVHFKSRLILFFVGFTIIPTVLLFFFASDLISRNIDQWFNTPLENILSDIDNLTSSTINFEKKRLAYTTKTISTELKKILSQGADKVKIQTFLIKKLKEHNLDTISLYDEKDEIISAINPQIPLFEYKSISEAAIIKGLIDREFQDSLPLGKGLLLRTGSAFKINNKNILLIAGVFLPENIFVPAQRLSFNVKRYNQLKKLKNPMKVTYLLIFLFITLFIIFGAMWLAVHIGKEITVPIELLAEATEKISKGDFNVKINYKTSGEFGLLIESFNKMVSEIREKRAQIERQKNEILKQKEFQETVLENIRAGVSILNKELKVYEVNSTGRQLLGINEDAKIKGKKLHEIITKKEFIVICDDLERIVKLSPKEYEIQKTLDVNGERKEFLIRISKVTSPDNSENDEFVVVFHDITQAINAKRLSDWKNIAEKVAHELKNPLTPIKISAQRILRNINKEPEKLKKITEESALNILSEIDGIMNLLSNFLSFARLPEPKLKREDINFIVQDVVSFFREIEEGIEFELELSPYTGELMLDKEQIKRVFTNLINNSIEAMGKRGKISIKSYSKNGNVFIEFMDTGPGIPEEIIDKIFLPYFSTKEKGSGLGLAIVKQIIKEHKGEIVLDKNYKNGTKFIMRFER